MATRGKPEAIFQAKVVALAKAEGWRVASFPKIEDVNGRWRTSTGDAAAGWPDLTLLHEATGRLIFAELKTDRGRVEAHQMVWLLALRRCGQDVRIWSPRDWSEIELTLTCSVVAVAV